MKLFYGWVIVAAGIVISCISFGAAMSLGVFLQPIAQDTGWSRTDIATGAVLTFLAMAAGSLLWGALSDRFGTRFVLLCGGALLGLGLIAASRAETLLAFQLSFGVLSGLAVGSVLAPLTAIASKWFTRHRSLAVALVTAGIGLGSALVAPLARWIISNHDWRTAMFDLGLLAWAVILPTALLIREPPPGDAASVAAAAAEDRGHTVASALRSPQFAAIAGTFFACCAAHSGPIFHMISYAIDCGVNPMTAATVLGAAGVSSLVGRIAFGLMGDRYGVKPILIAGLLLQAFSIQLYLFVRSPEAFYALAMLFGLSYGGVMPLYAVLTRDYFGPRIMGTVFGAIAMTSTIGMAIGPWIGGMAYDRLGGYWWLYIGSCAVGVGAALIAWTTRPPRAPVSAPGLAAAAAR